MNKSLFSKKLLFSILTIIFTWLIIEVIGYTLFFVKYKSTPHQWGEYSFYSGDSIYRGDHPYLPYFPKPNVNENGSFNSWGNKSREPDNPKTRTRILCFGGSTTFGVQGDPEKTWPGQLQELLGRENYEVINAALNGGTTADSLVNLTLRQIDQNPDYILVYHGTNDLESSFAPNFLPDYSHKRRNIGENPFPFFSRLPRWLDYSSVFVLTRLILIGYRGSLEQMYSKYADNDYKNGPFGLSTFKRNLEHINLIAQHHGAKTILATFLFYKPNADQKHGIEFSNGWQKGINLENDIIRELSQKYSNIYLNDLDKELPLQKTMFVPLDFCHFTEEGTLAVAKGFYKTIKDIEQTRSP